MSVAYPYGDTVTVYLEVRDPKHGDTVRADEREIHGGALAPRVSSEPDTDQRTARVTTGMTWYPPPGHGVTAKHRVVLPDGTEWRVQGTPASWRNPFTGWAPGDQIELDRVEG